MGWCEQPCCLSEFCWSCMALPCCSGKQARALLSRPDCWHLNTDCTQSPMSQSGIILHRLGGPLCCVPSLPSLLACRPAPHDGQQAIFKKLLLS